MREAEIKDTPAGKQASGPGWFIMNMGDAVWQTMERGGAWSALDADGAPFGQFGIGLHHLPPGESPGFYHWESDQEGFLVVSGECLMIVEGEERRMRKWDYCHCPPGTRHIAVGAEGDEPCVLLMVGSRTPGKITHYPVDPVAAGHGVSVERAAESAREAYAGWKGSREITDVPAPWPPAGG